MKFFTMCIKLDFWKDIKNNLSYFYFKEKYDVSNNDIIILYATGLHKPSESGFVCYGKCNDVNFNNSEQGNIIKYSMKMKDIYILDENYRLQNLNKDMPNNIIKYNKKKYLKCDKPYTLAELPLSFGKSLINLLNNDEILSENDTNNNSDIDSDINSDIDSEENTENTYIPILYIPCSSVNIEEITDIFVSHISTCKECDITNNNVNFDLLTHIKNTKKIIFKELLDENEIDEYLELYFNEQPYKNKDRIIKMYYIQNEDSIYYDSIIILI